MALELETTRAPGGAMTTKTPGVPSTGYGDLFKTLIDARANRPRTPVMPRQAAPLYQRQTAPRAAAPRMEAPQPEYVPTMGTQQSSPVQPVQRVSRMRKLQGTQDPNAVSAWAGSKQMNPGTMVEEYQLPDGSWSLDAVYGTLAGNEAAARAHQQNVYRVGGGESFAPADDSRMASLVAQSEAERRQYKLTPQQEAEALARKIGGRG